MRVIAKRTRRGLPNETETGDVSHNLAIYAPLPYLETSYMTYHTKMWSTSSLPRWAYFLRRVNGRMESRTLFIEDSPTDPRTQPRDV